MVKEPRYRWIGSRVLVSTIGLSIAAWSVPGAAQPPPIETAKPPPPETAPPAAPPPPETAPPAAPTPPLPKRSLFGDDPVEKPPLPPLPPQPPLFAEVIETRSYKEGDPIPPGFHVKKIEEGPLFIAGAIVLGASYVGAVVTAIVAESTQIVNLRDENNDPVPEDYNTSIPLVIPVAGPFITIGSARSSGAGTALLIAAGATQAAGLGMLIAGLVAPPKKLVRFKTGQASFSILPSIRQGGIGVGIVGAM